MKDTITKHYPNLTGQERFQLFIKAAAEGDETEMERLAKTCPKKDYRMNDAAFLDRMEGIETLTVAFCLDLAETHGELGVVRAFDSVLSPLADEITSQALISMDKCYEEGFKHGWRASGRKGKAPIKEGGRIKDPKNVMAEKSSRKKRHFQEMAKLHEALQGRIKALWEAFSEVCRDEVGLEPELALAAYYPPALEWLEDDLAEDTIVNKDIKDRSLNLMRDYWKKRVRELTE